MLSIPPFWTHQNPFVHVENFRIWSHGTTGKQPRAGDCCMVYWLRSLLPPLVRVMTCDMHLKLVKVDNNEKECM